MSSPLRLTCCPAGCCQWQRPRRWTACRRARRAAPACPAHAAARDSLGFPACDANSGACSTCRLPSISSSSTCRRSTTSCTLSPPPAVSSLLSLLIIRSCRAAASQGRPAGRKVDVCVSSSHTEPYDVSDWKSRSPKDRSRSSTASCGSLVLLRDSSQDQRQQLHTVH